MWAIFWRGINVLPFGSKIRWLNDTQAQPILHMMRLCFICTDTQYFGFNCSKSISPLRTAANPFAWLPGYFKS